MVDGVLIAVCKNYMYPKRYTIWGPALCTEGFPLERPYFDTALSQFKYLPNECAETELSDNYLYFLYF